MKNHLFISVLILVCSTVSAFDGYHRSVNIDVLHYEFALAINDSTNEISGRAAIDLKILENTGSVSFDLKGLNSQGMGMIVAAVSLDGNEVDWKQSNEKVLVFINNYATVDDTLKFIIEYQWYTIRWPDNFKKQIWRPDFFCRSLA